jgi:uncharacterized membrane protein (UPF0127 family)
MDTPELRAMGMQFRTSMDRPMLFVFRQTARHSYHMRNVRMPLDLILMNSGGSIVGFHSMTPWNARGAATPMSGSCIPAHRFAIEAPAGWVGTHNLKIGDVIRWG